MRKIIVCIFITLLVFSPVSHAKIVADQELNDSVVFYFWDSWINPVGLGSGGYWLTFLKHIDKNESERYWMRLDSTRRDSISQFGKIYSGLNEYAIEVIDNPAGVHYRAGIGGRSNPALCPIHAFYVLSPEMVDAIGNGSDAVKITLDFQNRKAIPFPISEANRTDFKRLILLKRPDYLEYARKP